MSVWGIVLAAGSGSRFGAEKQFELIGDRSVVDRSVDVTAEVSDRVVVALPAGASWSARDDVVSVVGGATRAASVRAALEAVADDAEIVVIHDAARPLAGLELFELVVAAVRAGADGAVPGLEITDTVKRVDGSVVVETLARSGLVAVQTPQAFGAAVLRWAHGADLDATDDAALVERVGGRVVVVPGDPSNVKITRREDLDELQSRSKEWT